jgi:hypothetical protein
MWSGAKPGAKHLANNIQVMERDFAPYEQTLAKFSSWHMDHNDHDLGAIAPIQR